MDVVEEIRKMAGRWLDRVTRRRTRTPCSRLSTRWSTKCSRTMGKSKLREKEGYKIT